jgi:hypothetical protein
MVDEGSHRWYEFTWGRRIMLEKCVVVGAAWFEIVVGAIFLIAPSVPCVLLFGATPDGVAMIFARWAGIALISLGITFRPWTAVGARAKLGLLAWNAGAAFLFTWVGVAATLHGPLLWPAAILHAVIAAALLPQFVTTKS